MFSTDPLESAVEAGLRYVKCGGPCIRRIRFGRSFRYVGPDGRPVRIRGNWPAHPRARDSSRLDQRLDLPLSQRPLAGVGADARGRKQYRYHPRGAKSATRPSSAA